MHYNYKVDILRVVKTKDTLGSKTEKETVLHNDEPCRINWATGKEQVVFSKETAILDGNLYCRYLDVTVRDRLDIDGTIYEIVGVSDPDMKRRRLVVGFKRIK
ncbi:head-tail adaptor protein [Candidatus Pacearchaeota archaeon]|nr:head-tail adaptor protein [Candidatus Pacearchaeota archaeon]